MSDDELQAGTICPTHGKTLFVSEDPYRADIWGEHIEMTGCTECFAERVLEI